MSAWRSQGERIALVPTMGALHAGHVCLIEAARRSARRTIITVFVNPTQFAAGEDFGDYPRSLEADVGKADAAMADLVFAPEVATMYPHGFATTVSIAGPALAGLEDRIRPTHFAGVATIVTKLLQQAQPDCAFFGEKDFQQLRVIQRMVRDLDMPIDIIGVPTHREPDGLAMSSRNVYLTPDGRERAPVFHRVLLTCSRAIGGGGEVAPSLATARATLADAGFDVDYLEACDSDTLAPAIGPSVRDGRLIAAVRLGGTRLIDNVPIAQRGALPGW